MRRTGFYITAQEAEEIGFSVALVYIPQEKDIQFSIMIGNYIVAIGYTFGF